MEIHPIYSIYRCTDWKDPKSFGSSIPSEFSKPSRLEVVAENIAEQGINNQRTKMNSHRHREFKNSKRQ